AEKTTRTAHTVTNVRTCFIDFLLCLFLFSTTEFKPALAGGDSQAFADSGPHTKLFLQVAFTRILAFHKVLKVRKIDLPEASIVLEPRVDRFERRGIELVKTVAAAAVL